jgi:hypothetical protein
MVAPAGGDGAEDGSDGACGIVSGGGMSVFGEILTLLVFVSGVGLAALAAGVGLDAWWSWCEALERRSVAESGHADVAE